MCGSISNRVRRVGTVLTYPNIKEFSNLESCPTWTVVLPGKLSTTRSGYGNVRKCKTIIKLMKKSLIFNTWKDKSNFIVSDPETVIMDQLLAPETDP